MHKSTKLQTFNTKTIASTALLFTMLFAVTVAQAVQGKKGQGRHHQNQQAVNQQAANQEGSGSENIYSVKNLAYYGDWDSNRVFIIDIDNMALLKVVEDTGDGPYGIDQQGASKAYALTRKTESLTIVDNHTLENVGQIPLQHKPRSTHLNENTGLSLVAGADKAMTSIVRVDRDKVVKVMGFNEPSEPHDYGGSLATGHPLWADDKRFFMLDRAARQIQLWSRKGRLFSVLDVPTSVHHIFQSPLEKHKNIFYAVAEGNQQEQISPSIVRFKLRGKKMVKTGEAILSAYAPDRLNPAKMGAHHADFHPDGVHIYIGSAEGHIFVVNKNSMTVETMIDTGKGSGHTTFAPMHNLAFITNHNDTYMTVIDTTHHKWIKNIEVATSASADFKSQAHTSSVSHNGQYFYSAASHDGVFFEIDMDSLEVSRRLYLGGNALMGSFVWGDKAENM